MVTVPKGIQYWTVPYTGTYEIIAVGALGGYDKYGSTYRGGGCGRFYSNGRSSKQFDGNYGYGGGGFAFINAGTGRAKLNNAVGGFGGGAYGNGGGAGGYSGGASGDNLNGSCGGGGSYNVGKNQVNKSAFNDKGDGYVVITRTS
ncbi:eggshell protein 2A-like [Xenia sp. Carnegie-2017]|uniref:eggshell protein 2A-like n=1 Tax=Xenia sp. Carnegie-2017 TaxID=2897299 RepID=UPI001F03C5DC|nr:eggshell protein 2A-like [Xenia sp. Carnegie-2017]